MEVGAWLDEWLEICKHRAKPLKPKTLGEYR